MPKELLQQALDALTRLSFLGNGDFPGNSEGNRIAQKAVADIKQALSQQEQPAQEKCWCDQNNIGEPEVSCGDCPTRDYKQPAQEPVVARPIGFDYLDSGQLIATYALPVEGKSHPKLYTHPAPPPPALSDLIELAKVYSQRYASPHHIVFSVDGLRHLIEAHLKGQK